MRQLTITFCFLLMSFIGMADCLTTLTGPTSLCSTAPSTGVYTVNLTGTGWLCGNIMSLQLSPNSGMMTSIVDADGNELLASPTNSFIRTRLSYPLSVTVNWTSNGCHGMSAIGGDASGFLWCGCTSSASLDVLVGSPPPVNNITLTGGEPATACGNIQLCASSTISNCANSWTWTIKGETITTSSRCISYFLETCPLGNVDVSMNTDCGSTNKFTKSFTCDDGGVNPYIEHEILACKGRFWSVDVPGSNVKVVVLNDSGNNIEHNGNEVSFMATELGPVVIQITFTLCSREFTQTLFVQVQDCGPIIKIIGGEDPVQNRQEQKPATDLTSMAAEVFPNPVVDILNIQFEHPNYTAKIYNLQGQLLKQMDNLEYASTVDISGLPAGTYLITLGAEGTIITKKINKQ